MKLQHSTQISSGLGLVEINERKQVPFRHDGLVEPQFLDAFEPSERVQGISGRAVAEMAGAFQRYQGASTLTAYDILAGMKGKAQELLGSAWKPGQLSQTGDRFEALTFYLNGTQPGTHQFLTFLESGETRLATATPCEGGRLEHSILRSPAGAAAWENLTFYPS